jgi:hypothetical protein
MAWEFKNALLLEVRNLDASMVSVLFLKRDNVAVEDYDRL